VLAAPPQVEHCVKVSEFKSWLNRTGGSSAETVHHQKVRHFSSNHDNCGLEDLRLGHVLQGDPKRLPVRAAVAVATIQELVPAWRAFRSDERSAL
jgi:hypothetical protein